MTRGSGDRERGFAIVLFALWLLPAALLAALVLDLGLAGAWQGRLQMAAELAVRDAARGWRGDPGAESWCDDAPEPDCDPLLRARAWDQARRGAASARVAALFAEGSEAAPRQGPPRLATLALGGGRDLSDPSLLALLTGVEPVLDDEQPLAANLEDRADGDLVGGRFLGRGGPNVGSCGDPARPEPFGENCRYERADFAPRAPGQPDNRSLLLRLRLTGEDPVPGIRQPDRAVPVLFGRLAGSVGESDGPALRARGLRVRATSIADARPALVAGPPAAGGPGVANFAVDVDLWRSLPVGIPARIDVGADGVLAIGGSPGAGRLLATPVAVWTALGSVALPVSGVLEQPAPGASPARWIPLFRAALDGIPRVVAFGVADFVGDPVPALTKRPTRVGEANLAATGDLRPALADLAPPVVDDLLAEVRLARACDPADVDLALACAPVLVR